MKTRTIFKLSSEASKVDDTLSFVPVLGWLTAGRFRNWLDSAFVYFHPPVSAQPGYERMVIIKGGGGG